MKAYPRDLLRKALAEAPSYRDFLKIYFDMTSITYAEVARRGGFASRSYPRDITEGRRRLTARSLPPLLRGLTLEPHLSELFQLLFYQEYPDEFSARSSTQQRRSIIEIKNHLALRIQKTRRRASREIPLRKDFAGTPVLTSSPQPSEKLIRHLFEILASLGTPEKGVNLDGLKRMTGLDESLLTPILATCAREGLLRLNTQTNRYYPSAGHLNLTGIPKNQLIRRIFLSSLDRVRIAADQLYDSDQALFYVSAISVAREDLPRLKTELRELLLRFADAKVEDTPEPDTVIYVVGSMFEARQT